MCVWATLICFDTWWEHSKPTTVIKVTSWKMHFKTQSKEDKQYTNIWLNTSAILLNQQMSLYQSNGSPCTTLKATTLLSYKLLKKITWACTVDLIICSKYLVMIVGLRTMADGVVVKGINLGCRSSLDIKLSFSRYIFYSLKKVWIAHSCNVERPVSIPLQLFCLVVSSGGKLRGGTLLFIFFSSATVSLSSWFLFNFPEKQ